MSRTYSPFQSITFRKLTAIKLAYDTCAAAAALCLAFMTRFSLAYLVGDAAQVRPDLKEIYLGLFAQHIGLFVAFTIGTLWLLGFYRPMAKTNSVWRPLKMLGGVSVAPALWSLFVFYSQEWSSAFFFPRGVTLLAWGFLVLLVAGPRILKYYLLKKMVIEVHHHRREQIRRVLVIGGAGYIGSQLSRDLLAQGYQVRILDSMMFGSASIEELKANPHIEVVEGDFRNIETIIRSIDGMDAVIHLGGIVGDPACALNEDFTIDINLTATKMLAEVCKAFKVHRFIFASSCSVYGAGVEDMLTEESQLNPVSLYARTKIASEEVLLEAANAEFSPTILRFATLFGLSPRPRFDLFVNLVTAKAVQEGEFKVMGGAQWRPFVHVKDICRTISTILTAPTEKVHAEIFNVGSDENTMTIADAGRLVLKLIPSARADFVDVVDDPRDYRVSFAKLRARLGIAPSVSVEEGIKEMRDYLIADRARTYSDSTFSNVKQTEKILSERQNSTGRDSTRTSATLVSSPREILGRVVNS
jgi:nucleoside-diphosphate-sugar epimerase